MPTSRRSYRGTLLLCGLVVLGWLWDFALGGGLAHSLGWLAALLLVGGISALVTHSARVTAAENPPPIDDPADDPSDNQPSDNQPPDNQPPDNQPPDNQPPDNQPPAIRVARPAELSLLVEIEQAADQLFAVSGIGPLPGPASIAELAAAMLLLVAGDPPVGYAWLELVDGQPYLAGLSVRPRHMRRGIGTALVQAACDWAAEQGFHRITLCTFARVAWNGPFYAGIGFHELAEPGPGLREIRADETRDGLDALGRRIVMCRSLAPASEQPPPTGSETVRSDRTGGTGTLDG